MIYSNIDMYMTTAKRGVWQKLNDRAKAIQTIHLTAPSTLSDTGTETTTIKTYDYGFDCLTDGAFFIKARDLNNGYYLKLVAPDNSIDISYMANMTLSNALAYLSSYTASTPVPGWDRFLSWFNSKWAIYGSYSNDVEAVIAGETVSSIPAYDATNDSQSVWFAWLKQVADNSAAASKSMSSLSDGNGFTVPFALTALYTTTTLNFSIII